MIPVLIGIFVGLLSADAAQPVGVMSEELSEARHWVIAKFEGVQAPRSAEPALIVLANHDLVWKNGRGSRPMHIVDKEYARGLYCHAFSKIIVRLPSPGANCSAIPSGQSLAPAGFVARPRAHRHGFPHLPLASH